MKHYVIYLPAYTASREMANHAVRTGREQGWDVELFEGVDGQQHNLGTFDLRTNIQDSKCRGMMERPGVQGCLISHWQLWNQCYNTNQPIGIFEHDIEFVKPYLPREFTHVLKLEGFDRKKARPAGEWYEGARAYLITPAGAEQLIKWIAEHGCLPADVQIGHGIVDIQLCNQQVVQQAKYAYGKDYKHTNSFTWNLENMEKT